MRHLSLSSSSSTCSVASSSSSSASLPPALRKQLRACALRPSLLRKERAATLKVGLQRLIGVVCCRCRPSFFFSWLSSSFLSRCIYPFDFATKKILKTIHQLFAAHPQGQRGDTLLQPVDYSVSLWEGMDRERERRIEREKKHHRDSRSRRRFPLF